jgi:hypothetical protein
MALPEYFAVYDRQKESFQILHAVKDTKDAITELQPWARPPSGLLHPFAHVAWEHATEKQRDEMLPWLRGNAWFLIPTRKPTDIPNTHPHTHSVEIGGKIYTWWSTHHKLVWTNFSVFQEFQKDMFDLWIDSPAIPILEFAYRHVVPRTIYPCSVRYDAVSKQGFEAVLDEGRQLYCDIAYKAIDPKDLRIQRPIGKQMNQNVDEDFQESDTEELDQRAPRWRHTQSSVPYADASDYESGNGKEDEAQEDTDDPQGKGRIQPVSEFCASVAIFAFAGIFIGLYSFIFFSAFETIGPTPIPPLA